MKIVSWNLAGRVKKARDQMLAATRLAPDVIAFQEVTAGSWAELKASLDGAGWKYLETVSSVPAAPRGERLGPRRYGLVLASRSSPQLAHATPRQPWPERILTGELQVGRHTLRVVTSHVPPGSSNGQVKVQVLRAIAEELRGHRGVPTVFVGDLNAPQEELPGQSPGAPPRVVTWAQTRNGNDVATMRSFRGESGESWDLAERDLTQNSAKLGYRDVYRELHPILPDPEGYSWCARTRTGDLVKRRFDHVLATPGLRSITCRYIADLRESKLSDHCLLEAEFALDA